MGKTMGNNITVVKKRGLQKREFRIKAGVKDIRAKYSTLEKGRTKKYVKPEKFKTGRVTCEKEMFTQKGV